MASVDGKSQRRRRHTDQVAAAAFELAAERAYVEGVDWTGRNDMLFEALGQAAQFGVEIDGRARRMDLDGSTQRSRCAEFVQRAVLNQAFPEARPRIA